MSGSRVWWIEWVRNYIWCKLPYDKLIIKQWYRLHLPMQNGIPGPLAEHYDFWRLWVQDLFSTRIWRAGAQQSMTLYCLRETESMSRKNRGLVYGVYPFLSGWKIYLESYMVGENSGRCTLCCNKNTLKKTDC
jgi:hypothetical protein